MKTIITREEFSAAMLAYDALSEAIEARIRQHTYVEALLLSIPNEPNTIFVATYDLTDSGLDFSVPKELYAHCETCAATFFKSDDPNDLRSYLAELISEHMTDQSLSSI